MHVIIQDCRLSGMSMTDCYNIINALKASFSKYVLYSMRSMISTSARNYFAKYLFIYPRHSTVIKLVPAYQADKPALPPDKGHQQF